MYSKINTQGDALSVVSLQEAKAQLNIMSSNTMDDGYITSLIYACVDLAQKYTRRQFTQSNVTLVARDYYPVIPLHYGEASTITSLVLDDVDITADTDKYELDVISEKLHVNVPFNKLQVSYDCGYVRTPPVIKQGVLVMITSMYEQRSDYVVGMSVETVSTTATDILRSVKYYAT